MAPSATPGTRPRPLTILGAAFLAGGAAAVGLNHFLDVHLSQRKPVVESEPIFIAMRSLPTGAPVTVWDVALRNWPKAMLPTTAMRVEDSFDGMKLKMPLREGQPLLSVQLEPLIGLANIETSSTGTVENGGLVVLDDRTKVQTRWPKLSTRQPAATPHPDDAARSSAQGTPEILQPATDPHDSRLVIGPTVPLVAEGKQAVPSQMAVAMAQPNQMGTQVLSVPDPQPEPPIHGESVPDQLQLLAVEETTALVQTTTVVSDPREETLVDIERSPESPPVITAVDSANPASVLAVAPEPDAVVASMPKPAGTPTIRSQRHLVVPQRVAVMVDEVTTAARARDAASTPETAESLRKLNSPASTADDSTAGDSVMAPEGSSRPSFGTPSAVTAQTAVMRANPLRNPPQQNTAAQTRAAKQPADTPQPAQVVPRVDFPQAEATLPLSGAEQLRPLQDRSSNLPADEEEADGRLFPRLSTRIEKAGEDWTRFRRSVFGESQQ